MHQEQFDLLAPLPTGTVVLEASAGTGKTYAIVGLATRYLAEGLTTVDGLLLVTFGRQATRELRERMRARLADVTAALRDPDQSRTSSDPLVAFLANGDPEEIRGRLARLEIAVSDFDAGTIATTHSFCQRMLVGLGVAGDLDPSAAMVDDVLDLVDEATDDHYLSEYAGSETSPSLDPAQARIIARAAVADRQAGLVLDEADTLAGERTRFASTVRAEVERRKRLIGVRDFDDLLVLLHRVLADPTRGEAACARIRSRFSVVLVDEFQDTDPLQWDILRRVFHERAQSRNRRALVLVGDPKQAIYAFRGAEVLAYLEAVSIAGDQRVLGTNHRTDAPLLDALETLYGGAALGDERIVAHPVQAYHLSSRIPGRPALRVRHLPRTSMGALNRSGFPAVGAVRPVVAEDVADQIVHYLSGSIEISVGGIVRPVAPADIAVLVRTNNQRDLVRAALERVGVPAVLTGGTSVFATSSAMDWLRVLQGIEQPHRADRVRLAALTPLLGITAAELDRRGDAVVVEVAGRLRAYAALFATAGFAALFERLGREWHLESRLLALEGGERQLTDLRHIAQLLNTAAVEGFPGSSTLTRWLADRIAEPTIGAGDRSRRLDSDGAAVQVATVHVSKGLEFPVVFVPYGWDYFGRDDPPTLTLHEDGRRVLDVGGPSGRGFASRKEVHESEQRGEELRLLYVALTRAQCQVVLWWAPMVNTGRSPLHRLLFGRTPGVSEPAASVPAPADAVIGDRLAARFGGAASVSIEPVDTRHRPTGRWSPPGLELGALRAATFDRVLDLQWRRTSYTALTASAHADAVVGSEPESPGISDEPLTPDTPSPETSAPETSAPQPPGAIPSPMNGLPAGAAFGTLVHEILEFVDTSADDLRAELIVRVADAVAAGAVDADPAVLASALLAVMTTPLRHPADPEITLGAVAAADRLSELDFELPLAGGESPVAHEVTLTGIVELLRRHVPADDVLGDYADRLASLDPEPLRGFLTGSIDSVLRIHGAGDAAPRFLVVDYKTNRIVRGESTTADFTRESMAAEMSRSHYPLQALLYCVALHRYLTWRLPGYRPEVHLGGVQYHFVRGMVGPNTPPGCGVFDWTPPVALITDLSVFLAGGAP